MQEVVVTISMLAPSVDHLAVKRAISGALENADNYLLFQDVTILEYEAVELGDYDVEEGELPEEIENPEPQKSFIWMDHHGEHEGD